MHIAQLQISQKSQQQAWNSFVESHPYGSVHQLTQWAQFQSKSGTREKFWLLAAQKESKNPIQAGALILRQDLPLGLCWLYCPGGPLLDWNNKEAVNALFSAIRQLAKQQKAVFFRFEPPIPVAQKNLPAQTFPHSETDVQPVFSALKAKKSHAHYQPQSTLLIDLTPPQEQILAQMKPKGRYNIKVAKKHAVHVRESDVTLGTADASAATFHQDLQSFYNLLKTTAQRDQFHVHPLEFYQQMLEQLGPQRAKLYLAEYVPTPSPAQASSPVLLSAAIVTFFKDTATYYFGASSDEYRNTMAPYLLHWEILQSAKNSGYKTYDLFGIAPADAKNHPWQKVTEFKMKFGGTRLDYTPAREIVYRPWWLLIIRVVKKIAPQMNHWLSRLR